MTSNSLILARYAKGANSQNLPVLREYGCSEFVALDPCVESFTSLGFFMMLNSIQTNVIKAFGKDSSLIGVGYMQKWIEFVFNMFSCMNIVEGTPFISLYTWADFKAEIPKIDPARPENLRINIQGNSIKIEGPSSLDIILSDDTVIGINVNVEAMRKHFDGAYYVDSKMIPGSNHLRKVQLPHTALRVAWSSPMAIAIASLKIMSLKPNMDPFYVFQLTNNLRGVHTGDWGADYGHLFTQDNDFVSKSAFLTSFKDKTKNGVQCHFAISVNPLVKMVKETSKTSMKTLFSKLTKQKNIIDMVATNDLGFIDELEGFISKNESDNSIDHLKVKFKFNKTIFKTTVAAAPYDGYRKVGQNIDRILFQDEEGTVLSIAEKSKLIELV